MTQDTGAGVVQQNTVGRIIGGLALLAPALLCCITELLIPTIRTFNLSLHQTRLLGEAGEFIGLKNYAHLGQDRVFADALGFTLLLLGARLLVVAIVPLLLVMVVNQFGRSVQVSARLLYTLPIVLFAPVVVALTWLAALNPTTGLWPNAALVDPQRARQTVLLIDMLYTLGLAGGIGLIVYLAALRIENNGTTPPKPMLPLIACWLVGLLTTIGVSLQSFSMIFVLTRGGPANSTLTLGIYQYIVTFQRFSFGLGAAIAGLNLVVLLLLGIVAGLLIVGIGLRLTVLPKRQNTGLLSGKNRPLAVGLLLLVLLVSLSLGALSTTPILWNILNAFKTETERLQSPAFLPASPSLAAFARASEMLPLTRILINTVVPLTGAVLLVQLPLAYLGALGIGALRPLGRRSEWLLLPFSPWLFVSTMGITLNIPAMADMSRAGTLNTLIGLAPPVLLSVPMLVVLTLFFKGQTLRWAATQAEGQPTEGQPTAGQPTEGQPTAGQSTAKAFFRQIILPSLPLAALLAGVAIVWGMQELLWPLIVAATPDRMTLMTALLRLSFEAGGGNVPVTAAAITMLWLPVAVLFFLFLAAFQIFYLDRLSLSR